MIVTPSFSREMGEGGRLVGAGGRVPTLGLPDPNPTYKPDMGGVYKTSALSAFDHNKNSVSDKDGGSGGSLGPLPLAHHLPFTAPWLAEVAHITPARPTDHLPYPQPPAPHLPDYYPHYPSLPHRPPGYYPHHFLNPSAASHFLRDYPRHTHRPYPLDPRPTLERPTPVSGASLVRPLGPPPLRGLHPDPRDMREIPPTKLRPRPPDLTLPTSPSGPHAELSPRGPHGEPSPKRRGGAPAFPMPAPRSPRTTLRAQPNPLAIPGSGAPVSIPLSNTGGINVSSSSSPVITPSTATPSTITPTTTTTTTTPTVSETTPSTPENKQERPSSPYHAHFARGALVTVGSGVRKVEELQTKDFLEAAKAAEDLMLDPSTVAAITPVNSPTQTTTTATTTATTTGKTRATITFTFPSRNTQVSVEASLDHPFFVFHSGWSSCSPERTQKKYDLKVRQLQVGDVCVSLTKKVPGAEPTNTIPPPPSTPATFAPTPGTSTPPKASTSAPLPSTSPPATKKETLPFLSGADASSVWSKPTAAARTTERQHSSDEAQKEEKDPGRKRRWSDPGQPT